MIAVNKPLLGGLAKTIGEHVNELAELRHVINKNLNQSMLSLCESWVTLTTEGDLSLVLEVRLQEDDVSAHLCRLELAEFVDKVQRGYQTVLSDPISATFQAAVLVSAHVVSSPSGTPSPTPLLFPLILVASALMTLLDH